MNAVVNMMSKRLLLFIFVLGLLLVVLGIILNPSFVAKYMTADKIIDSSWKIVQIRLIQIYAITFGVLFVLGSLIIGLFSSAKGSSYLIWVGISLGIVLPIIGLVLGPSFVQKNLSPIQILEEGPIAILAYLQLGTITLGCLVILVSLLLYRVKFLDSKKSYSFLFVILVFALYCVLVYMTYIKVKYPDNIILKPSEFSKIPGLLLGRDILLRDYQPTPILVVEHKQVKKAKYPIIDVHFHMASSFATEEDRKALEADALVKTMDLLGIKTIINLDGGGRDFEGMLNRYQRKYPDRFINFYPIWFPPQIVSDEFLSSRPGVLEEAVKIGARGLKLWKYLGLKTRDSSGKVIPVDDTRLDPLWSKAAELEIPVLWHMGDPAPFFEPVNRFNERYDEVSRFPDWSYYSPRFPSREALLKQRENVFRNHPETIFIGAHMGCDAENLGYIAYLLDTFPNYYVEFSSMLPDLGRQPNTTREFFIKYQDRILFGSDGGANFGQNGWTVERFYQAHFEFLETDNDYIEYPMQGAVNQGRWRIYGISLPDEVLEKIYYKNAEKILFKKDKAK